MHELSICTALLRRVEVLASNEAGRVSAVRVTAGPLSGVEPHLLVQAFRVARTGSKASTAELIIERAPVQIRCLGCGYETETAPNALACPACGSERTQLLSGDELLLTGIDLLEADAGLDLSAPLQSGTGG